MLDAAKNPRNLKDFHGYLRTILGFSRISSTSCEIFLRIYGIFGGICQVNMLDVVDPAWVNLLFMQDLSGRSLFLGSYDLSAIWFLGNSRILGALCAKSLGNSSNKTE